MLLVIDSFLRAIACDRFLLVPALKTDYLGGVCGAMPHKHPPLSTFWWEEGTNMRLPELIPQSLIRLYKVFLNISGGFIALYNLFTFLPISIVCLSFWQNVNQNQTQLRRMIMPYHGLVGLALVILLSTGHELIEILFSLFLLFYSIQIFQMSKIE